MRLVAALAVGAAALACASVAEPRGGSAHSCWTAASPGPAPDSVGRGAAAPSVLAQRLLERLGDRRFVKAITLAPPPPQTLGHTGYWRNARPPKDARWAWIAAPQALTPGGDGDLAAISVHAQALWEAGLVRRALRDVLCAAGGAPLVGSTVSGLGYELARARGPSPQRFQNPPASVLRQRVAAAADRYGFRVVELRLLGPLGIAPLLVIETDRDRKDLGADFPAILTSLLAGAYEGFYLEARDADGPFLGFEQLRRGQIMGGSWGDERVSPFRHLRASPR
jgi:hypothetical protein